MLLTILLEENAKTLAPAPGITAIALALEVVVATETVVISIVGIHASTTIATLLEVNVVCALAA